MGQTESRKTKQNKLSTLQTTWVSSPSKAPVTSWNHSTWRSWARDQSVSHHNCNDQRVSLFNPSGCLLCFTSASSSLDIPSVKVFFGYYHAVLCLSQCQTMSSSCLILLIWFLPLEAAQMSHWGQKKWTARISDLVYIDYKILLLHPTKQTKSLSAHFTSFFARLKGPPQTPPQPSKDSPKAFDSAKLLRGFRSPGSAPPPGRASKAWSFLGVSPARMARKGLGLDLWPKRP